MTMEKKNTWLSILALVLAIASLAVSVMIWLRPEGGTDYAGEIQALQAQNAALQSQLDSLSQQINSGSATQTTGLQDWDLALTPWSNGEGASVTLTAVPGAYQEGMTAFFYIRKGSAEISTVECDWTGEEFTATADLAAQDGYSYYCILTSGAGEKQQFALTTPENPVEDIPVYLANALRAYCNLTLDSWLDQDGVLTVTTAYAQAQLPLLTSSGEATIEKAELVLYYNEEAYSTAPITLEPGTAAGAYELTVTNATLSMPQMNQEECLDLYLEVTLNDGQVLTSLAASWYQDGDALFVVVG